MRTSEALYDDVVTHLGGEARLQEIGARANAVEGGHVSLRMLHPNPRGVRSVIISEQPNGLYNMTCFGPISANAFRAETVGSAAAIVPESLASVLGMLTGLEKLHHRHF